MRIDPRIALICGALVVAILAFLRAAAGGDALIDGLEAEASQAIEQAGGDGVEARFMTRNGWRTRHPVLSGGESLDDKTRVEVATAVSDVPGIGGVSWSDGTMAAEGAPVALSPDHCQDDVEALLRARSIRFEESSSALAAGSGELLDEVTAALRPCLGSIIAITGHTDKSGPEPGNIALSRERANIVRDALTERGIPRDGLRTRGLGSSAPVDGLPAEDPANRRIEFSVVSTVPITPTPVDTPSAR